MLNIKLRDKIFAPINTNQENEINRANLIHSKLK